MKKFRKVNKTIFTFLLLFLFSFTVQADETELQIDATAIEASDEFVAHYTIEIPKSIHMQKNDKENIYEANYELKITNLDEDDERSCLVIEPDYEFQLEAKHKEPITVYVEQEETEFSNLLQEDLYLMHTTTGYLFTMEPLSSAEWTGSFSFYISLLDLGEPVQTMSFNSTMVASPSNAVAVNPDENKQEIEIATPSNAERKEVEESESNESDSSEEETAITITDISNGVVIDNLDKENGLDESEIDAEESDEEIYEDSNKDDDETFLEESNSDTDESDDYKDFSDCEVASPSNATRIEESEAEYDAVEETESPVVEEETVSNSSLDETIEETEEFTESGSSLDESEEETCEDDGLLDNMTESESKEDEETVLDEEEAITEADPQADIDTKFE